MSNWTDRELETLDLLSRGWSNHEIAEHFRISYNYVSSSFLRNIYDKLHLSYNLDAHTKRAAAVGVALRKGLIK